MLTPVIGENLKDIEEKYSPRWFEEALKEAVKVEHRNLKYIEAILERWETEGFKALKKGSSTIYLEYSRPWEGGEKGEWTCTVNVVVK